MTEIIRHDKNYNVFQSIGKKKGGETTVEILKIPEKHLTEENMNLLSEKKTVEFPVRGASGEDKGKISLMGVVVHPCLDRPFLTGVAQRGDRKYFFKGMKLLNGCIILHLM